MGPPRLPRAAWLSLAGVQVLAPATVPPPVPPREPARPLPGPSSQPPGRVSCAFCVWRERDPAGRRREASANAPPAGRLTGSRAFYPCCTASHRLAPARVSNAKMPDARRAQGPRGLDARTRGPRRRRGRGERRPSLGPSSPCMNGRHRGPGSPQPVTPQPVVTPRSRGPLHGHHRGRAQSHRPGVAEREARRGDRGHRSRHPLGKCFSALSK